MSRIGKKPVPLPDNVTVTVIGRQVTVEAAGHQLSITHRPEVTVRVDEQAKVLIVHRRDDHRVTKAMHGLTRSLIANMVEGVTKGFTKDLEVIGVGWSVQVQGPKVLLNVGYADTREVQIPDGVTVQTSGNRIKVSGADKQKVGQIAAEIRSQRPPEPYSGKGIKYLEEVVIRKAGKQLAGTTT